jgi:ATP synthase protein I
MLARGTSSPSNLDLLSHGRTYDRITAFDHLFRHPYTPHPARQGGVPALTWQTMQLSISTHLTEATTARRVLSLQAILTSVASAAALPFGYLAALSVLIGGGACLVANAAVVLWVFRDYRAQVPGALVMRFYSAEVVKIALLLGLFAAAFATIDGLDLPLLLGSYFVIQVLPPILAAQTAHSPPRRPKAPDQVR